jgi:hypothetical protein
VSVWRKQYIVQMLKDAQAKFPIFMFLQPERRQYVLWCNFINEKAEFSIDHR